MLPVLKLLGVPRIIVGGTEQGIPTDKRGAFLIYLASKGDWLHREQLCFLFWPDSDDKTARRNLRQIINRSKKLAFAENLEFDDQLLRWHVDLDSAIFKEAIAQQNWAEATKLYSADFCDGLNLADSNGFQDWLELEREAYASAFVAAARQQSDFLLGSKAYREAAQLLKYALQKDDLAEDVLQRYLQAAYLAGQKEDALKTYKQFTQRLERELDLAPLEETRAIISTIEKSEALSFSEGKETSKQLVPLSVMRPPKLIGRQDSVIKAQASNARLTIFRGEAGVGKTRLMAELAPTALLIKVQEGLTNIPFNAVASFIQEQQEHPLGELGAYLNDLLRLIPELEPNLNPGPADPLTAKQRLLEALARYFEACATNEDDVNENYHQNGDKNYAVAFDDIQWLDTSSLEFLIFFTQPGQPKAHSNVPQV